MTLTLLLWLLVILCFIANNLWITLKHKRSPDHWRQGQLRCGAGFLFVCLTFWWYPDIPIPKLIVLPIVMVFTFWWIFDSGYSIGRGNAAWKLDVKADKEKDSSIDGWQQRNGGEKLWWGIKLGLAVLSTTLFIWI